MRLPPQPILRLAAAAALLAALWVGAPTGRAGAAEPGRRLHLKAGSYDPVLDEPPVSTELRLGEAETAGAAIRLLQLRAPLDSSVRRSLAALGVRLLQYLPENGYVVRLPPEKAPAVASLTATRYLGPLHPGLKFSPDLGKRPFRDPRRREAQRPLLQVELLEGGPPPQETARRAEALGADLLGIAGPPLRRLTLRAGRRQIEALARLEEVAWIEEAGELVLRNDTTRWVLQSNVPDLSSVWARGIRGEGQMAGIIDGKIDLDSCYFRDPSDNLPRAAHRKVVAYRSESGLGSDSHGTHVAGTLAGDQQPLNGATAGNGLAYRARLSFTNAADVDGNGGDPSNLYGFLVDAHRDGARVHNNSWGDDSTTEYTGWCVDTDRFSHDYEESLVVFAVTAEANIRSPENAKNALAVAASGNGAAAGDFCQGGSGPTADGRRKPDLFAPGCDIVSARYGFACDTYTLTGTSMAAPAASAAALLVRQYFTDGFYPTGTAQPGDALEPSGALLRAMLVNSSVDMTAHGGPPPGDEEGWGRILLEQALFFPGDLRRLALLADTRNAEGLASAELRSFPLVVSGSAEPLRVTLAFTDSPGSLLASDPVVNDLDLEVEAPGGTLYRGNRIDGGTGESIPGGTADPRNNIEQVQLSSPPPGTYTVRVRGSSVHEPLQGFALIATGEVAPAPGPLLGRESERIEDLAPYGNGDGILDPGETATLPLLLRNSGAGEAREVEGFLSTTRSDLLRVTRRRASYPDLPGGGSAESMAPHYELTLQPEAACGDALRLDLDARALGHQRRSSWDLPVGRDRESYPGPGLPLGKKGVFPATLEVADDFLIADLLVSVDLSHGNLGEIVLTLTSPEQTTVTLHDHGSAGTADLVGTYDTELLPSGPGALDDFLGQSGLGTWTLTVEDTEGSGTPPGTLNGWSLHLVAETPFRCDPLLCGSPLPGPVGDSLRLAKDLPADIVLSWQPAPGASLHRVWKSSAPSFEGDLLVGETGGTALLETGGLEDPGLFFYRVRGVNDCRWEGP